MMSLIYKGSEFGVISVEEIAEGLSAKELASKKIRV